MLPKPRVDIIIIMISACTKWTALMNRPENNFRLGAIGNLISSPITLVRQGYKIHNQFSENCYWLVIGDLQKKAFVQACSAFWSYYLLSYNPNILAMLNLVLTLSLIYPFLAFFWRPSTLFWYQSVCHAIVGCSWSSPNPEVVWTVLFSICCYVSDIIFKNLPYSQTGNSLPF